MREQLGAQVTAFEQVIDGERVLRKGDALHMATKPIFAGRALHFLVGQVSTSIPSCGCHTWLATATADATYWPGGPTIVWLEHMSSTAWLL